MSLKELFNKVEEKLKTSSINKMFRKYEGGPYNGFAKPKKATSKSNRRFCDTKLESVPFHRDLKY